MGVKPGRWHWGRNAGWGCLRIGCCGDYLELRGTKWQGKLRKLYKEELNDLYSLPNIVRMVKSRRMTWAGHVARREEDRVVHRVLVRKPEGWRTLGRPRGRIILRWIFRDLERVVGTEWSWLRIGTGGGHLWVRWGTFGIHKSGEFLDYLQSLLVSFSSRTLLRGLSKYNKWSVRTPFLPVDGSKH
jgi:hypothetical protein